MVLLTTDNLVIIDDSIVRGTTLKMSIIKMMDRLNPKRIVVVSSAPQIRYPDCYGIDMAKLEGLVAFRAALELLKERNQYHIVEEVYLNV
jgi:amidophosphoribosyltransferase